MIDHESGNFELPLFFKKNHALKQLWKRSNVVEKTFQFISHSLNSYLTYLLFGIKNEREFDYFSKYIFIPESKLKNLVFGRFSI